MAVLGVNWLSVRLLEKLFGRGAVGLRAIHMRFDPCDLFLQSRNTLIQLVDRKWIEILLLELGQRVLRLVRKQLIQVHSGKLTREAAESISRPP